MRSVPGLVLLALCLAAPVEAQTGVQAQPGTIAGVVIDDRTEQPIRGVSVYVENQANIVETDVNGRFSLMAPRGPQTIIASVIGYALLRADIEVAEAALDIMIRLSEGAGAYTERVTVSGSLRSESDSLPGSMLLYGRELENLRGAVLADRAFNWSGRRLVFVDVANVLNHTNYRNASYFVDRGGRVFETTESLIPIVPSGGLVIEF